MSQWAIAVTSVSGEFNRVFRVTADSEQAAINLLYPQCCLTHMHDHFYRIGGGVSDNVVASVHPWKLEYFGGEFYDVGHWAKA